MKIAVCDRCYNADHKITEALKVYTLTDKAMRVKGELCTPHANEAKKFYDKNKGKPDFLKLYQDWLYALDAILSKPFQPFEGKN